MIAAMNSKHTCVFTVTTIIYEAGVNCIIVESAKDLQLLCKTVDHAYNIVPNTSLSFRKSIILH